MGRWKPPQQRGANYITRKGHDALQQELRELWLRRRDVVSALSAAAAEGDRSENAEYIYRKKELGGIDRRIRYLKKRLEELKVVNSTPTDTNKVYFGAAVTLEDEEGELQRYRIVGPDEANPDEGSISIDSPLGKALIGKALDDEISLVLVGGERTYTVADIDYCEMSA